MTLPVDHDGDGQSEDEDPRESAHPADDLAEECAGVYLVTHLRHKYKARE